MSRPALAKIIFFFFFNVIYLLERERESTCMHESGGRGRGREASSRLPAESRASHRALCHNP